MNFRFFEKKKLGTKKGMTIIEGLILLAIFSIVTMAFYEGYSLGTTHIINSKKRLQAIGLATEKMEALRSLPYSEVAVAGGVPNGTLNPNYWETTGNSQFHILTSISYFDDPDDGTLANGTDSIPNDYKLVVIRVLWGSESSAETITLRSFFVPAGLETAAGGGILSINVIDSGGLPVSGANVRIQNSTVSPAVDTTLVTGADGNVSLIGAKPSNQKYVITVSKAGYETVTTQPPYPLTAYYPMDVHMTAINNAFTTSIIISSRLASLELSVEDPLGDVVPGADFSLIGGRVIGVTPTFQPVYSYTNSLTTDSNGRKTLTNMNPGSYRLTFSASGYILWTINYGGNNEPDQIILNPGTNLNAKVIVLKQATPGYFVKVVDQHTAIPVDGATVKLSNATLNFSAEEITDQNGYAYFPRDASETLTNGVTYDVEVTHSDYTSKTANVTVNNLTTSTLQLDPN